MPFKLDTSALANFEVDVPSTISAAAEATGNKSFGSLVNAGVDGAAEGAAAAVVVGEVAVIVGATIATGGDIAAAIGIGAAAGAGLGTELGPIGAAVGAVIGVLIAIFGKSGPTAFQTTPFEGTSPIKIFQGIVGGSAPRLCIEIMQDQATAIALCTWAANNDFSSFDAWFASFQKADPANGAIARLDKLLATYTPTAAEIDALARVPSVITFARQDASLAPGDDQAVQVLNALADPIFAATVSNVDFYNAAYAAVTRIQKKLSVAKAATSTQKASGSMNSGGSTAKQQQDLQAGWTHWLIPVDLNGKELDGICANWRQACIAVAAVFATPVGAEDGKGGVIKPLNGAQSINPPRMMAGGSSLTVSLNQWHAAMAAIHADAQSNPGLQGPYGGPDPRARRSKQLQLSSLALAPSLVLSGAGNAVASGVSTTHSIFARFWAWLKSLFTQATSTAGSVTGLLDNPMFSEIETPLLCNGRLCYLSEDDWRQALINGPLITQQIAQHPSSPWSQGMRCALAVVSITRDPNTREQVIAQALRGNNSARLAVRAAGHAKIVDLKMRAESLATAALSGDQGAKQSCLQILEAGLNPSCEGDVRSARLIGDAIKMRKAMSYDARASNVS